MGAKYLEGKGLVICTLKKARCPKHPKGHRFVGLKKCKGCPNAAIGKYSYLKDRYVPVEKYQ